MFLLVNTGVKRCHKTTLVQAHRGFMLLTRASLNLKSISHAPDCLDILWLGCVKLNLLTNLFDMYRNGRNISDRLHIPDFTEQLFFCDTWFGCSARKVNRSNSFVVNAFSSPFTHTRRAVLSILMPRISTISFFGIFVLTRRS